MPLPFDMLAKFLAIQRKLKYRRFFKSLRENATLRVAIPLKRLAKNY